MSAVKTLTKSPPLFGRMLDVCEGGQRNSTRKHNILLCVIPLVTTPMTLNGSIRQTHRETQDGRAQKGEKTETQGTTLMTATDRARRSNPLLLAGYDGALLAKLITLCR